MQITLNGKQVELADGIVTISQLLEAYQLRKKIVVVEHNGEILDRSHYESKTIADRDRIEIVHFVGGG
ncbi:sulfur carrier protein ThiS [Brevibacillus sp. TJ4]|uniref:sulfur carrier protein ThiS n=1 Tax=Brevibacillus sp. TJ4 TaxID=3234853 RepID=UPI003B9FF364